MTNARVIDADGHVTEPADLWETYLERTYRARAIRIAPNEAGLEALLIDGKRHHVFAPGTLGVMGGIGMDPAKLLEPGVYTYRDACPPGGYEPHARLKVMDEEGIDVVVLYPTIGHKFPLADAIGEIGSISDHMPKFRGEPQLVVHRTRPLVSAGDPDRPEGPSGHGDLLLRPDLACEPHLLAG